MQHMGHSDSKLANLKYKVPSTLPTNRDAKIKKTYVKKYDDFVKESTPVRLNSLHWTLPIKFEKFTDVDGDERFVASFTYDNYEIVLTLPIETYVNKSRWSRINLFKSKDVDKVAKIIRIEIYKLRDTMGRKDVKRTVSETCVPINKMLLIGPADWEYMLYLTKYDYMIFDTPENIWHEKVEIDPERIVFPVESFIKTNIGWKEDVKRVNEKDKKDKNVINGPGSKEKEMNSKTDSLSCPIEIIRPPSRSVQEEFIQDDQRLNVAVESELSLNKNSEY